MTDDRARQLRAAFDRGFAEPPPGPPPATVDVLRIRLAGDPFAIALADVGAIHIDLPICPVPTGVRELLGLAAIRATVVPIYDLRAILGVAATERPRWSVVAPDASAGFAFDGFDGMVRVRAAAIAASTGERIRGTLVDDGRTWAVLDLAAIAGAITASRQGGQ